MWGGKDEIFEGESVSEIPRSQVSTFFFWLTLSWQSRNYNKNLPKDVSFRCFCFVLFGVAFCGVRESDSPQNGRFVKIWELASWKAMNCIGSRRSLGKSCFKGIFEHGTSLVSLIPLAPLSLLGFYMKPTKSLTFSRTLHTKSIGTTQHKMSIQW